MPPVVEVPRRAVELPSSSLTRQGRHRSFAKLLYRVDLNALSGFGFHGKICRPGARIPESELWPTAEYPARPVLLEYVAGHGRRGHQTQGDGALYVLWTYDRQARAWIELGRASGTSTEWVITLQPLAVNALAPRKPAARADVSAIASRIVSFLDGELTQLESEERHEILDVVHNQLASRMCAAG
jgi:hypothetical protein